MLSFSLHTSWNIWGTNQSFGRTYCLTKDGGSRLLRNVGWNFQLHRLNAEDKHLNLHRHGNLRQEQVLSCYKWIESVSSFFSGGQDEGKWRC